MQSPLVSAPGFSLRPFLRSAGMVALFSSACAWAQQEIPLWREGSPIAPGLKHAHAETVEDKSQEAGRPDRWISYVSDSSLTVYPATGPKATGAAVLVVPGGGFRFVCIDKEGTEAARWLNSLGITAAVFKYRVLEPEAERTVKAVEPIFADTERAMRVLRQNAAQWKIDPKRIGVLGFSAGGTMAVRLAVDSDSGDAAAKDPVERVSSRPDFVALIYSGLPGTKLPKATKESPPVFIAHAVDDPKAPVAVAVKTFQWMTEGGGSVELHLFRRGDHGFGVTPKTPVGAWTTLCASWLRDLSLIAE